MVGLGIGLGAAQFIPLFELASVNFRDGTSSFEQVLGWAHPLRDMAQFVMPNFYGSPAHHSYFNLFSGQTVPATVNALGQPIDTIDWGIKNYVEGALYLGILPLALAAYGLVGRKTLISGEETSPPAPLSASGEREQPPYRAIFALLTLVALTFMFGLLTYGLVYGLPGISQLHSPFRWIFAVTLGVAALAGFGADSLSQLRTPYTERGQIARRFGYILSGVGAAILISLFLSRLFYPQIEPLIVQIFRAMAKAPEAFADARMFYSYQFTNALTFGLMTLGAGMVFWLATRDKQPPYGVSLRPWHGLMIGLVGLDLMIASWGFNPASDPLLLDFTPPAIEWLLDKQETEGRFRYTTLDDPALRPILPANLGWRYGLDDIRGYESIIPKQYVEYMQHIAPQTQLEFNRVAPIYLDQAASMDWERLALLNVRYIITHKTTNLYDYLPPLRDPRSGSALPAPAPAYEDEAARIWEIGASPRAYVVQILADDSGRPDLEQGIFPGFDVAIDGDTGREKILHANISPQVPTSWLVVSETYMPGWRAFVRPRGGSEATERPLEVERVLENFQGMKVSPDVIASLFRETYAALPEAQRVALDAGQITVRMAYNPASFQLGLFGSFISAALVVFIGGVYLWRLYVSPDEKTSGVQVVAKNSLAPIILNLFNRGIDFGFAFIMLRILGPEGAGIYYYAAFIFGWFDIFTNFGLNVFLTREVSRDRRLAWRLLLNTSILRFLLMAVGVVLLAGFLTARQATVSPPLLPEAVLAIGLLYVGLLPNSLSTGLSALFYAFEKAEIPAAITTLATISKATLGVAALALGYGVVGLAGVSIVTNVITLGVLAWQARTLTPRLPLPQGEGEQSHPLRFRQHSPLPREGEESTPPPTPSAALPIHGEGEESLTRRYRPDWGLIRGMVGESWPLMLNHFLATIFFQIDVVIIEAFHGARMVGQYSVAYKWVAALNVIPAFFTMALLPVMARQAREDRAALRRNYGLAIKLLAIVALPTAVIFTFLAYTLTGILGGAEYLPDGAIATQLMIWSIPIGWMNSLTQYVLVALDLQRRITRAFFIAVTFNIVANLIFIPTYGYRAAAIITILSEAMLLIPFALLLGRALGRIDWMGLIWRPGLATLAMIGLLVVGWPIQPFLALVLSVAVYGGALLALRPLDADEMTRLRPLIPARLRKFTLTSAPSPSGRGE